MNNHSMHVTAIIMCGGRGTRMGKSTEEKPLQKLKGRMLIEYVVDALVGSNIFERIVGVTSSQHPQYQFIPQAPSILQSRSNRNI